MELVSKNADTCSDGDWKLSFVVVGGGGGRKWRGHFIVSS
jgi:hypothetical protein